MTIEKSLSQAPLGLEPDIEIEIENPESIVIEMGGIEIEIEPETPGFYDNLAEEMSDNDLNSLASDLVSDFESDIASRKDWMQTYVDGIELLGMTIEERAEPWEGACGIYHPLVSEALVKFQSETIASIFPAQGPVKTKIIGKETQENKDAARRVQEDMNYELTETMSEYRAETERLLWGTGLSGNGFRKIYDDSSLGRQVAIYCPAEDVVVPYGASNIESAERVTHVMRKTENEMRKLQVNGFYRDTELGAPNNTLDDVEKKIAEKMGFQATSDNRYKLLEMMVELDLPGFEHTDSDEEPTGIALPYVVTIEKGSNTILSIRRNWEENDKHHNKRQHFVHYGYIPAFGFYHFGLIHLIGAYAKSGTSIIRQLVDAGTLSNLPGGFKTKGMRVKGDDTPIAPGEFRDVDIASGTLKDNIMPLPYKEPSQVLMAMLNSIIEDGRRFANTADMTVSDMSAQAPVGTTLALLERSLRVMSAVQARIHFSLKQELKLLKKLIAERAPEEYSYEPVEGSKKARRSDYERVDVIPVSDPNAATMAQKIVQYQAVLQLAQGSPQLYNMPFLHRQMLEVLGLKEVNKLIPIDDDHKPTDPVTENQNALNGKPMKAFAYQDHEAHITVHMAAIQDPKIAALVGQSPMAQSIQAAMQAHISEHLGFAYRIQIEKQLGMNLPPQQDEAGEDIHLDPEYEARLAPLLAEAAQRLLQQNQSEAAQQQAQKQAQDPMVQLQQAELQLKQMEIERKSTKDKVDAAAKADQLSIERERIETQKEIAGLQAGIKAAIDQAELEAKMELEGLKQGFSVQKNKAELLLKAATEMNKGSGNGRI
jgi:hypothetical protein